MCYNDRNERQPRWNKMFQPGRIAMKFPQPIPYQGSKRNIAKFILAFFPDEVDTLVEPFAGSAAISIAAALSRKASKFHLNDINMPLMGLWEGILSDPEGISTSYARLWHDQTGREKEFYFLIRDQFNKTQRPEYLLYLLARCVKASIRYNSRGEFNQSPDNRRKGRRPRSMEQDILAVSQLLQGKTTVSSKDYGKVLKSVSPQDLVYMDPPYQGVCGNRDPRYYTGVELERFLQELESLVNRRISFILSYDGRRGDKTYGKEIPSEIGVHRIEINAGRSSQSTLLGRNDTTYESIYLSRELVKRLGVRPEQLSDQ